MCCASTYLMSSLGTSKLVPCHIVRCLGLSVPALSDCPGHDRRYALDSGKVHAGLGWVASSPVVESLVWPVF